MRAVNTVTGLHYKHFFKIHHECWLSRCLSEVEHTIKGKANSKCENRCFLKTFDLNPEFSGLDFHLYFIQGHKIKAEERELQRCWETHRYRWPAPVHERLFHQRDTAMPVQVASPRHDSHFAAVCSMPRKTGLGRVANTGHVIQFGLTYTLFWWVREAF